MSEESKQTAADGLEVAEWPPFEDWLARELAGSDIKPEAIRGDARLFATRAWFCGGLAYRRLATDSQRLLAQRDAEIAHLKAKWLELAGLSQLVSIELPATTLESQQAASVGGEREAGAEWIERHYGFPASQLCLLNGKDLERAFSGGWQARAALSPPGGGVVMPEPMKSSEGGEYGAAMVRGFNACLREVARLNAKPQANSKEEM